MGGGKLGSIVPKGGKRKKKKKDRTVKRKHQKTKDDGGTKNTIKTVEQLPRIPG